MAGAPLFTPPRTPLQSLQFGQLIHQDPPRNPQSSSPCLPSSPLNPYSSGKPQRFVTSKMAYPTPPDRRATYKARKPAYTLAPAPEPTHNAFLRGKLKAKCAERIARDRSKAKDEMRKRYQSSSSDAGNSSDIDMDDEDADELDDPLFLRVMAAEVRRERHREHYSFERQVGSSFDPDLEDLENWEYEDDLPEEPPEGFGDEDLAAEYEAYLESSNDDLGQQEGGISPPSDSTMMTDTTAGHTSQAEQSRNDFLNHILQHGCCPQCGHKPLSISSNVDSAVVCSSCQTTYPLDAAASSWVEDHPHIEASHRPLWSLDPFDTSAILFQCSSNDCVWLSGL